jgi:hypothetical protein
VAIAHGGAQQHVGVALQQERAGDTARGFFRGKFLPGLSGEPVQDAQHLVHIGQHVRLRAAQRRHPQPGQLALQATQIGGPHRQEMHQIARAVPLVGARPFDGQGAAVFGGQHRLSQRPQALNQRQAHVRVPGVVAGGRRCGAGGGVIDEHAPLYVNVMSKT